MTDDRPDLSTDLPDLAGIEAEAHRLARREDGSEDRRVYAEEWRRLIYEAVEEQIKAEQDAMYEAVEEQIRAEGDE